MSADDDDAGDKARQDAIRVAHKTFGSAEDTNKVTIRELHRGLTYPGRITTFNTRTMHVQARANDLHGPVFAFSTSTGKPIGTLSEGVQLIPTRCTETCGMCDGSGLAKGFERNVDGAAVAIVAPADLDLRTPLAHRFCPACGGLGVVPPDGYTGTRAKRDEMRANIGRAPEWVTRNMPGQLAHICRWCIASIMTSRRGNALAFSKKHLGKLTEHERQCWPPTHGRA